MMSRHFKCDKSLSSCRVYSGSVHNGGGHWQLHHVSTKGFRKTPNLAGTWLAKFRFSRCFPSLWRVNEKKTREKKNSFHFGTIGFPA